MLFWGADTRARGSKLTTDREKRGNCHVRELPPRGGTNNSSWLALRFAFFVSRLTITTASKNRAAFPDELPAYLSLIRSKHMSYRTAGELQL